MHNKVTEVENNSFEDLIKVVSDCKKEIATTENLKCHQNNEWVTPDLLILIAE